MKNGLLLFIASGVLVCNVANSQTPTLQTVTTNGNSTTTTIKSSNGRAFQAETNVFGYSTIDFLNGGVRRAYTAFVPGSNLFQFGLASGTAGAEVEVPVLTIPSSGRVGIGTIAPVEKLHVAGSVRLEGGGVRFYTPSSDGGGTTGITANPNGWTKIDPNGSRFIMTVNRNDVNLARNILDIEPVDTWTHLMELHADGGGFFLGNVGIGTNNPGTYKLAVEGTLGARKIKVTQAAWADFVFDSSYQLAPLYQVEKYIQQNKHLPDVPSASEVKKEGLDVGDSQALLLRKIEELTLYIIEQNKKIDQQNERIQKLELERTK